VHIIGITAYGHEVMDMDRLIKKALNGYGWSATASASRID